MSFIVQRLLADPVGEGAAIGVLDRGFQLGDGVFDTMAAFGGRAFLADRHLARLRRHAEAIGIATSHLPLEAELAALLADVGRLNAIIRITITRGQAARGLWPGEASRPSLLMTAQPWSDALLGQPARLGTASVPRNQHSPVSHLKSLAYLDNILAAREAAARGVDDALILNLDGNAVCSTIANVFAVVGGSLVTPPTSDGCLDGITRGIVLEEAAAAGLACTERSLTPALLADAGEIFLTNSVRLVRPVTALDGRSLPAARVGQGLLVRLLARIERDTSLRLASPS